MVPNDKELLSLNICSHGIFVVFRFGRLWSWPAGHSAILRLLQTLGPVTKSSHRRPFVYILTLYPNGYHIQCAHIQYTA